MAIPWTVTVTATTSACTVTVDVSWTNNGGVAGTFAPSIDDTTPTGLPLQLQQNAEAVICQSR